MAQQIKLTKEWIDDNSEFMDKHMTLPAHHADLDLFWVQKKTRARHSWANFYDNKPI